LLREAVAQYVLPIPDGAQLGDAVQQPGHGRFKEKFVVSRHGVQQGIQAQILHERSMIPWQPMP
jgi:hypothetical protein